MSESRLSICKIVTDKEGSKSCRACAMGMLVSWHLDTLREKGFKEKAEKIETVAMSTSETPDSICKFMEKTEADLPEDVKNRLEELNKSFDVNATASEEEEA